MSKNEQNAHNADRGNVKLVDRLFSLIEKPSLRVVGLMSGTSADGVDVAVVDIDTEGKVYLKAFDTIPHDADFRERLIFPSELNVFDLCDINFRLGEVFATAVEKVFTNTEIPLSSIDLIGSHGQTVAHLPSKSSGGSTLQLCEASVLAERFGVPVVADFRVADVAAGGAGAPLVPVADRLLYNDPNKVIALQNFGGIANVTLLDGPGDRVLAFDNGPGNMPLDCIASCILGVSKACDKNGNLSAFGKIDDELLHYLHLHPFLSEIPPRTAGRELFGHDYVADLVKRYDIELVDLMATVNRFVAESVFYSYERYLFPVAKPDVVWVCGGGVHNKTLMTHLIELFNPIQVIAMPGKISPDAREAVAFAVLAHETLCGRAGNIPNCTGARHPTVLGKIVPGPLCD